MNPTPRPGPGIRLQNDKKARPGRKFDFKILHPDGSVTIWRATAAECGKRFDKHPNAMRARAQRGAPVNVDGTGWRKAVAKPGTRNPVPAGTLEAWLARPVNPLIPRLQQRKSEAVLDQLGEWAGVGGL